VRTQRKPQQHGVASDAAPYEYERIYEINQRLTAEPKLYANYLAKHRQKLHE
jgi:hypothetical protein